MNTNRLSKLAITCLLTLSPLAAEAASPSLYALSKRPDSVELLTYDLNGLTFPSFTYVPTTVASIDPSLLGADSIIAIATDGTPSSSGGGGGGGSTPVPEPSTYALMMIGMLALTALKGRRTRPRGTGPKPWPSLAGSEEAPWKAIA